MSTKSYDRLFKILVVGDSGVGKTCLLNRFSDNMFNKNFIPTIGIDFKIKTINLNGKIIKLQIWDTAGQERFNTITHSYYRGANGVLLVYDVTDSRSFDNLAKWLRNIEESANEQICKTIVGNKIDLDNRIIATEKAEKVAYEYRIPYIETSAKTNTNIVELFFDMAERILETISDNDSNKSNSNQSINVNQNQNKLKLSCVGCTY